MKKLVLILVLLALTLTACRSSQPDQTQGGPNAQLPAGSQATDPTEPDPTDSSPAPTDPTPTETEPTEPEPTVHPMQAELDMFTALFGDLNSWYNRAISVRYDSPSQLRLLSFFGLGFDDESREPTDAEWAELKDRPGFDPNMSLMRLPKGRMNEVLTQYFGITLEDMIPEILNTLVYLESTDCYYFMTTGADGLVMGFQATDIETLEDGTIVLTYTVDSPANTNFEVGLKALGEGYQILFNRKAQ